MTEPKYGADLELLTKPADLRLDHSVVWLTGASRGLGRALAFAFAGVGAELLLCSRSAAALEEVAATIREHGGVAETVVGSVADPGTVQSAIEIIEERWGTLDVLVNNAGVSPVFVPAEQLEAGDWRTIIDVNLSAPFACAVAAMRLLERAAGGSVINVSSVHGVRAPDRLVAYAASKGGLEMVTRSLALEWAPRGVRVNSVAPGYLETDMTAGLRAHERWSQSLRSRIPMGRFGATSEVAPAVLFLASPCASYITGTTLFVDGGWTAA